MIAPTESAKGNESGAKAYAYYRKTLDEPLEKLAIGRRFVLQ